MKKIMKITIILIILFIATMYLSNVFAAGSINTGAYDPSGLRNSAGEQVLIQRAKIITGVIKGLGIIVAVLTMMVYGVKLMVSSVEEKADLKKALPGYLLGAVMVFAITVIPALIYENVKGL